MIRESEFLNELATALSKAQGELADAEKSSDNPFFKSKYADLAEVLGQIRPVFSANGLSLVQFPSQEHDGHVDVTSRLMHSSGQWLESTLTMPVQGKNIAQDSGSVITYMRRYAAAAIAGIAQVDTDANQSAKKGDALEAPKEKTPRDLEWMTQEDFDNHKEGIISNLIGGKTALEIVQDLRLTYKVAKKWLAEIEALRGEAYALEQDATHASEEQEDVPF